MPVRHPRSHFWRYVFVLAALLSVVGWSAAARAEERMLFDFEAGGLSKDWAASGKISVAREQVPAVPDDPHQTSLPGGSGIVVKTMGQAAVYAKRGRVPAAWNQFHEVSFWVYRDAAEARERPQSVLEVQMYEADGHARFWRRVELDHTGWREVTLPLRWFRWGDHQRIPRWEKVDRFVFWFRDAANLTIDAIHVAKAQETDAAYLSPADLRQLAFPDDARARVVAADHAVLLTNAAELDADRLLQHFGEVSTTIFKEMPYLDSPERRPVTIVFASRDQYRAFTTRLAAQLNSAAVPPESSGYTIHAISTSYWDREHGSLRPVFTHEFVHSLLCQSERLPSQGGWLHEGIASYYQLRFHPQKSFPEIVRQGLANEARRSQLPDVCRGQRVPLDRYWQALTVVELLRDNPKYDGKLADLLQAFENSGSTDLNEQIGTVLQTDWQSLTSDWINHCRQRYAAP